MRSYSSLYDLPQKLPQKSLSTSSSSTGDAWILNGGNLKVNRVKRKKRKKKKKRTLNQSLVFLEVMNFFCQPEVILTSGVLVDYCVCNKQKMFIIFFNLLRALLNALFIWWLNFNTYSKKWFLACLKITLYLVEVSCNILLFPKKIQCLSIGNRHVWI